MEWSQQQQKALDSVGAWLKKKDKPYYTLAGFAGTGKTTLAKHLASQANGKVFFAAFTGKAAHVLKQTGVNNVSTLHKLIYQPTSKSQARLSELQDERKALLKDSEKNTDRIKELDQEIEKEKNNLARPSFSLDLNSPLNDGCLLIVDEYSMIDKQLGEDLLSFGVPVLALGDPGQLPPVKGTPFFSGTPDMLLSEIHRQAKDNPIIRMSMDVREGKDLRLGDYGESRVLNGSEISKEELADLVLATQQLLVGRNATRTTSNARIRELYGRSSEYPEIGDKLICLRNNHDSGLLNGQLWEALENSPWDEPSDTVELDIGSEENQPQKVVAHACTFRGEKLEYWNRRSAEEFDYGYALTVHKAQGSQWRDLVLFDEWYAQARTQWLYTAITRASEKITIVRM